ncbi:MAG: ribonuclease R [Bacteroidetes bacterium]|nr:ribonuclease R [Bacteroidota bacterium]
MGKKKDRGSRLLFEEVLKFLDSQRGQSYNYKQVASALGITNEEERRLVASLLADLAKKGLLEEPDRGKFRSNASSKTIEGIIDVTQSGAAYVTSPDYAQDIFISASNTKGALHRDTVRVKVFRRKRNDGRDEGEVTEIVRRSRSEFAGTLTIENRVAFFSPDNKKFPDFIIPKEKTGKAKSGQKVVVRMTSWIDYSDLPEGEVTAVLGNVGENETEINAIMVEFGLPYSFPKDVERLAELIPTEIAPEEISRRRDFRKITTFTIDPADAKDFDDALSVQKLANGNWEIGVHIADVSHYVKPGTLLDREAIVRATSVYLVDRVVPMLPEVLSNFVCSLRPDEEKLTFSAVFELDEKAQIQKEWFGRTVIRSDRRFAYEDVQEILEGKDSDLKEEIFLLDRLAKILRADRLKNGSITFEKEEVKFHLDENGNPLGVYFKVMKDSNQLIEDFMLLANRRVAEFCTIGKKRGGDQKNISSRGVRGPFVYRVHASPDPARVMEFGTFVRTFGYRMDVGSEKAISNSLNKLLKDVQGKPEANMIETLAIRTMAKAIYTTENIGHYGLGFQYYTHFTSPIRRYPDVLAHRLLQLYLDADAKGKVEKIPDKDELENECKHCSEREKAAADAERASIKYKQVQFLQDKVGEEFDGIISGVTEFGFFVELEGNKCEGMVHVRNLKDDRYFFEQENYCLRGQRNGKKFTIGDKVRVLIKSADLIKKQIDFELASGEKAESGERREKNYSGRKTFSETSGKDDWDISSMMSGKKKHTEKKKQKSGWENKGKKKDRPKGNSKKRW